MVPDRTTPRFATSALLGAGAVFGWILMDLTVYLRHGPPGTSWPLLPGCAVALGIGALCGVLWGGPRAPVVWLAVLLVASVLPKLAATGLSRAQILLPRALLLLLLAHRSAWFLAVRGGARALRLRAVFDAVLLGVLFGGLKTAYRQPIGQLPLGLMAGAAAALFLGGFGRVRLLAAATALGLGLPILRLLPRSLEAGRVARPDLPPPVAPAPEDAPNLVLVVLDTLRADRLAPYGYERVTTPRLDRFVAERMTRYTDVHSTSSWTLPSHASLFTGLLPALHGATNVRADDAHAVFGAIRPANRLDPAFETLAEVLRERGYRTAAIVSNCAYLDHRFGLDQGFEYYDDRAPGAVGNYIALAQLGGWLPAVGHIPYRSAARITDEAIQWLDRVRGSPRPFFLTLNYMEAHEPYIPSRAALEAFGDEAPPDPLKSYDSWWPTLYDSALLDLDTELARLLGHLQREALLDSTLLVITSDHGQALGEHGFYGHAWGLTEDQVRVPLYVLPVGGREGAEDETPMDSTGVHALLQRLLGLPATQAQRPVPGPVAELFPRGAPAGVRRWAAERSLDIDSDRLAWFEGRRKWVVFSSGEVRAFDLEDDPGEERPLALPEAERQRVAAIARAWWQAHPPPPASPPELTPDLSEKMNALGYGGQ